jgi:hypothetical protein
MSIDDVAIWLTREQRIAVANWINPLMRNPHYLTKCQAKQFGLSEDVAADTDAEACMRYERDYVEAAVKLFADESSMTAWAQATIEALPADVEWEAKDTRDGSTPAVLWTSRELTAEEHSAVMEAWENRAPACYGLTIAFAPFRCGRGLA